MNEVYRISEPEVIYEQLPEPQTTEAWVAMEGLVKILNLKVEFDVWHHISRTMVGRSEVELEAFRETPAILSRAAGLMDQYPWLQEIRPPRLNRETALTTRNFDIWAGNHLFDDFPGLFGITQIESHKLRGAVHGYGRSLTELRELAQEAGITFDHQLPGA